MEEISAEEKRLLEIENSKFLGGDMEHTHLVKGLDYQLLQKAKAEASKASAEDLVDDEREAEAAENRLPGKKRRGSKKGAGTVTCRTRIARGVFNTLFNSEPPMRNVLFQTGRRRRYLVVSCDFGLCWPSQSR
jgi:IK cytokine